MTLTERLKRFADLNDLIFHEDKDMIACMERNEETHGVPTCPCAFVGHTDSICVKINYSCPCNSGMDSVALTGKCTCGIFEGRQ